MAAAIVHMEDEIIIGLYDSVYVLDAEMTVIRITLEESGGITDTNTMHMSFDLLLCSCTWYHNLLCTSTFSCCLLRPIFVRSLLSHFHSNQVPDAPLARDSPCI